MCDTQTILIESEDNDYQFIKYNIDWDTYHKIVELAKKGDNS